MAKVEKKRALSEDRLRDFLREMLLIRRFEEKVEERFRAGDLAGFLHVAIGQEAAEVGVCAAMEDGDVFGSTHRAHGHTLARGTHPNALMAELYGKMEGCSHGYGGSMHLYDVERGNLGANAVVGGGIPSLVGAGLAFKLRDEPRVAVAFFGDGATNTGTFHESLNLAQLWNTRTLFVCENNEWAESTPGLAALAGLERHVQACARLRDALDQGRRPGRREGLREGPARRSTTSARVPARCSSTSRPTGCTATTSATRRSTGRRTTATRPPSATRSFASARSSRSRPTTGEALEDEVAEIVEAAVEFAKNGTDPQPEDALKNIYA